MRSTISLLALTLLPTPAVAQAPTPSSTTTVAKTNKTAPPVERPGVTVVAKTKEAALPAQSQPKLPAKSEPKREGLRLMPPKEYDHPYRGAGMPRVRTRCASYAPARCSQERGLLAARRPYRRAVGSWWRPRQI
jgi:hypothetical protein